MLDERNFCVSCHVAELDHEQPDPCVSCHILGDDARAVGEAP
jgi:nitrate reductase cytochrome c-type subunit